MRNVSDYYSAIQLRFDRWSELKTATQTLASGPTDRVAARTSKQVSELLKAGFANGEHGPWIERLLSWYYDPMYDYQLAKKEARIIFRGDRPAVRKFLAGYQPAG